MIPEGSCTTAPLSKLLVLLARINRPFAGLNYVLAENKYFSEFLEASLQF